MKKTTNRFFGVLVPLGVIIGIFMIQVILGVVFGLLFPIDASGNLEPFPMAMLNIIYGVFSALIFGAVYVLFTNMVPETKPSFKAVHIVFLIVLALCLQVVAESGLNIAYYYLADSQVFVDYLERIGTLSGDMAPVMLIYTIILAPVSEEFAFRGLIYKSIERGFGATPAIIIQALAFGIFHFDIIQSTYAFIIGLALGYLISKRRRITETIFIHILINITGIWGLPQLMDLIGGSDFSIFVFVILLAVSCAGTVILLKILSPKNKPSDRTGNINFVDIN